MSGTSRSGEHEGNKFGDNREESACVSGKQVRKEEKETKKKIYIGNWARKEDKLENAKSEMGEENKEIEHNVNERKIRKNGKEVFLLELQETKLGEEKT